MGGQRHANPNAKALTQRTGGDIGKREARGGVTFEVIAELAELQEFSHRDKAVFSPNSVNQRSGVAFGKNETVVVVIMRVLRIILHVPEKQRGGKIRL